MQHPPADILYAEQFALTQPSRGRAMWNPDTLDQQHPIDIGVVGFIEDGAFEGVIRALHRDEVGRIRTLQLRADEPIMTRSVKRIEISADVAGGSALQAGSSFKFACSKERGAILTLGEDADSVKALEKEYFIETMYHNYKNWLNVTNKGPHRYGKRIQDLLLVTGYDKTSSWCNAVFTEGSSEFSVDISFGMPGTVSSKVSVNWVGFQGAYKEGNWGPTRGQLTYDESLRDQAVFVRGLKMLDKQAWQYILSKRKRVVITDVNGMEHIPYSKDKDKDDDSPSGGRSLFRSNKHNSSFTGAGSSSAGGNSDYGTSSPSGGAGSSQQAVDNEGIRENSVAIQDSGREGMRSASRDGYPSSQSTLITYARDPYSFPHANFGGLAVRDRSHQARLDPAAEHERIPAQTEDHDYYSRDHTPRNRARLERARAKEETQALRSDITKAWLHVQSDTVTSPHDSSSFTGYRGYRGYRDRPSTGTLNVQQEISFPSRVERYPSTRTPNIPLAPRQSAQFVGVKRSALGVEAANQSTTQDCDTPIRSLPVPAHPSPSSSDRETEISVDVALLNGSEDETDPLNVLLEYLMDRAADDSEQLASLIPEVAIADYEDVQVVVDSLLESNFRVSSIKDFREGIYEDRPPVILLGDLVILDTMENRLFASRAQLDSSCLPSSLKFKNFYSQERPTTSLSEATSTPSSSLPTPTPSLPTPNPSPPYRRLVSTLRPQNLGTILINNTPLHPHGTTTSLGQPGVQGQYMADGKSTISLPKKISGPIQPESDNNHSKYVSLQQQRLDILNTEPSEDTPISVDFLRPIRKVVAAWTDHQPPFAPGHPDLNAVPDPNKTQTTSPSRRRRSLVGKSEIQTWLNGVSRDNAVPGEVVSYPNSSADLHKHTEYQPWQVGKKAMVPLKHCISKFSEGDLEAQVKQYKRVVPPGAIPSGISFQCDFVRDGRVGCYRTFRTENGIDQHIKEHFKNVEYICLCGGTFTTFSSTLGHRELYAASYDLLNQEQLAKAAPHAPLPIYCPEDVLPR